VRNVATSKVQRTSPIAYENRLISAELILGRGAPIVKLTVIRARKPLALMKSRGGDRVPARSPRSRKKPGR